MLGTVVATVVLGSETVFVLPYFTGNGEEGMKMAVSGDGYRFRTINGGRAVMRSALGDGLVRDPSIVEGPDGVFHAVWTTGWYDRAGFGLSHSKDLVEWSEPEYVKVMEGFAGTVNVWAPEIHWSGESKRFTVVWSSTVRGRFDETLSGGDPAEDGQPFNHRMYAASTADFRTWSSTSLFYDGGFNVIDGFVDSAGYRGRRVMVVKDETRFPSPAKSLRLAFGSRVEGPWGAAGVAVSPAGVWSEGPSLVFDGKGWRLYFDRYMEGRWGLMESEDLVSWRDSSSALSVPKGARHGSVFLVGREKVGRLLGRD